MSKTTEKVKQQLHEYSEEAATQFDFDAVEAAFADGGLSQEDAVKLRQALLFVLNWLLKVDLNDRRVLKNIGKRAIAMAWVIDPDRFRGEDERVNPSLRQLSRQLGFTAPNIAPITSEFSRLTGILNQFQFHGWNRKNAQVKGSSHDYRNN
jgi:hypothetical protein